MTNEKRPMKEDLMRQVRRNAISIGLLVGVLSIGLIMGILTGWKY